MQQLQSLVAELFTAPSSTLNDERDSAEHSLSRAAALLRSVEVPKASAIMEPKSGLAPWQMRKVTAHIESNLDRPLGAAFTDRYDDRSEVVVRQH